MSIDSIISLILADKRLSALRKKITSGKGTFSDTFDYTSYSANLMGQLFSGEVLDMPEEERKSTCISLLRDRYTDINALLDTTQRALDKAQGLALTPRHVPFDEVRAAQIGDSLTDKTVPDETIVRRAGSAPVTAVRSMHDDYIEENAEFRSNAGLQCYINRVTDGKCCKWCSKMAGRFEYGDEPDGIFRRHDNCGCSVTYECGRQRQNVWTKKTWEVPETGAGAPPPTVFSQEQARRLEQQRLAEIRFNSSSIDNSQINDIIALGDNIGDYYSISDEVIRNVPDLQPFSPEFDDDKDYTNAEAERIYQKAEEKNKRYKDACQAILYYAKDYPPGTECSLVLNNELKQINGFSVVAGTEGSVDLDDPNEYYHAFHNHGSDETFSFKDLGAFSDRQRMCSLTAVGNNGSCYNIMKMPDYNSDGFKVLLNEKGEDIIYQVGDKEISLSYLSDEDKKQEVEKLIDNLGAKQKEELRQAIKNKIIECIGEGENYGIKYSSS